MDGLGRCAGVVDGRTCGYDTIRYDDDGIGERYARDARAGDVDDEKDDGEDDGGASMRRSASRQW